MDTSIVDKVMTATASHARYLREKNHISVKDVGKMTGLSVKKITSFENAGRIKFSELCQLLLVYRVLPSDFLKEVESIAISTSTNSIRQVH